MTRRGQAALEFLSTYGFAFLLILLMIAALSYFGVLSPSRFLPERCLIQSEFRCDDRQLQVDTGVNPNTLTLNLQITNQLGNTVSIDAGSASATYAQAAINTCTIDIGGGPVAAGTSVNVNSGGQFTLSCVGNNGAQGFPAAGEKIKVPYEFSYTELGGAYPRVVSGEVAATIQ